MATPNYEQIQSFNHVADQLRQAAIDEFLGEMYDGITRAEIAAEAERIAAKFTLLGAELGAQWYDLCSELAEIYADPAEIGEVDAEGISSGVNRTLDNLPEDADGTIIGNAFENYLHDVINRSIRETGNANLHRDYERGLAGGRWARVPVGKTCAWCLMLASQGAWYLSEESALGGHAGHFHSGCDCVAVYHADPASIKGYEALVQYKDMYYHADNVWMADRNGKTPLSDDMKLRIATAKAQHKKRNAELEAENKDTVPWTKYNEVLIIMRDQYGLK